MKKLLICVLLIFIIPFVFALTINVDREYSIDLKIKWEATWNNGKYDLTISWDGTGWEKVGEVVLSNVSEQGENIKYVNNVRQVVFSDISPGNYAVRIVSDDGEVLGSFPLYLKDIKREVVATENSMCYLLFGLFMMLISSKLCRKKE